MYIVCGYIFYGVNFNDNEMLFPTLPGPPVNDTVNPLIL